MIGWYSLRVLITIISRSLVFHVGNISNLMMNLRMRLEVKSILNVSYECSKVLLGLQLVTRGTLRFFLILIMGQLLVITLLVPCPW